jgi:hypothetical protein
MASSRTTHGASTPIGRRRRAISALRRISSTPPVRAPATHGTFRSSQSLAVLPVTRIHRNTGSKIPRMRMFAASWARPTSTATT